MCPPCKLMHISCKGPGDTPTKLCMYVNFRIIYLSWWQRRRDDRTESPWRNCTRDPHAALGTGTLVWRTETPGVCEELPGTSLQWLWNKRLKEKEKFIINSPLKYLLWIWKMKLLLKSWLEKNVYRFSILVIPLLLELQRI